ncbi:MAG: hypothetical protein WAM79_11800 [Candidatus Sulfotelmatobacter sp.]
MLRWTAIFLLLTGTALAQAFVYAPSAMHDRYLDKPNVILLASLTAWQDLDAYNTERSLDAGGQEMFPVARHFCQSRGRRIAYFGMNYSLTSVSSYALYRMHHRKLARLALLAGSVSSASGLAYSLAHR